MTRNKDCHQSRASSDSFLELANTHFERYIPSEAHIEGKEARNEGVLERETKTITEFKLPDLATPGAKMSPRLLSYMSPKFIFNVYLIFFL